MNGQLNWTSATLASRVGGNPQLAHELVQIFLSEYPGLLGSLQATVSQNDGVGARRAAHALKGTVANFIDDGPTVTLLAIELAAADSRLSDIPSLMVQLERELDQLATAMRRQVASQ
jgi:hypothetical protein